HNGIRSTKAANTPADKTSSRQTKSHTKNRGLVPDIHRISKRRHTGAKQKATTRIHPSVWGASLRTSSGKNKQNWTISDMDHVGVSQDGPGSPEYHIHQFCIKHIYTGRDHTVPNGQSRFLDLTSCKTTTMA